MSRPTLFCYLVMAHTLHSFGDFFETPGHSSAQPMALGFDGFFKGSYSYHFHNFW